MSKNRITKIDVGYSDSYPRKAVIGITRTDGTIREYVRWTETSEAFYALLAAVDCSAGKVTPLPDGWLFKRGYNCKFTHIVVCIEGMDVRPVDMDVWAITFATQEEADACVRYQKEEAYPDWRERGNDYYQFCHLMRWTD